MQATTVSKLNSLQDLHLIVDAEAMSLDFVIEVIQALPKNTLPKPKVSDKDGN